MTSQTHRFSIEKDAPTNLMNILELVGTLEVVGQRLTEWFGQTKRCVTRAYDHFKVGAKVGT